MVKNGLVIFISGRGSNLEAIISASKSRVIPSKVSAVIADRNCDGINIAKKNNLPYKVINKKNYETKLEFEKKLIDETKKFEPKLIVLAGFLHILSKNFLKYFPSKIINIHPSLLPSFKGLDTHKRAKDAGVLIHGCTVHYVSEKVDNGKIIAQGATNILKDYSIDEIAKRILKIEHNLYPTAIAKLLKKNIKNNEKNLILSYYK